MGLAVVVVVASWLLWPRDDEKQAPSKSSSSKRVERPRIDIPGLRTPRPGLGPIARRPPRDGLVRVTGTVLDRKNHQAVGDVEVVFADGNTEASAVADVAGRYSIDLPPGRYRPFVRADGVISASPAVRERLPARPRPEQVAAARLDLAPAVDVQRDTDGVDLEVVRSGKVHGKVVDRNGHPIPGAIVRAFATDEAGTPRPVLGTDVAETGADGGFDLEMAAATYRLDAFHGRYGGITSSSVVVVEPAETTDAELTMTLGCVITGRVVGARGQTVPDGALERGHSSTDADGSFYPDGDFGVDGTFQWTTTEETTLYLRAWPWKSTHSQAIRFECKDGVRYDNVVFEIPDHAPDMAGRVLTADGRPVPYAFVDIGGLSEGTMNQQERADADGNWAVFALPAGEYRVTATADGAGAVERVVTSPMSGVDLTLSGTGRIAGRAIGMTDGSFTLAAYQCRTEVDSGGWGVAVEFRRVVSVIGGRYELDNVPACDLLHVVVQRGSRRAILEVAVPAGGTAELDVDVAEPQEVTVRGTVRDPDGRGIARALVTAISAESDREATFTETDDQGRFTLSAHGGDQIVARSPEGSLGLRWIERHGPTMVDLDISLDIRERTYDEDPPELDEE